MARNGVGVKGRRRRVKPREEDSDESDEEYKVTEDEECDESDECFSFDSDESEADFEVSEGVSKSRNTRRSSSSRKRNETIKSRKKRRIIYKEDDDDEEEEVDDEDDTDFMSLGNQIKNQIKKPAEKKRDSYTDVDDNDDDDDEEEEVFDEEDEELTSLGRKVNQIKKSTEKKEVSYTEVDDEEEDDYAEFATTGRNKSYRKNRQENKRVVYTEDEDDEEGNDDDDDTKFMFRRKRNSRNNPQEKKRVVYTEDDDDEEEEEEAEEEDDVEFMYSGRKVNQKKNLREKRKVSYTEDDEDDLEFLSTSKKDNLIKEEPTEKTDVSFKDDNQEDEDENDAEFMISESEFLADEDDSKFMPTSGNRSLIEEPREKTRVSYKEDNQEDEEDEKDAEFKLGESDYDDDDEDEDEDETPKTKKSEKISKSRPQKKSVQGRGGRKSKTSKSKKHTHSKQRNSRLGQKLDKNQIEKRNKKTSKRRRQRAVGESDSDFVSSASSDHDYTISEEEREQMREASVFCANLRAKLRSSSNGNQEEQPAYEQRKYPIRKGKEKVEEVKDEVGKQVCGICLSEEAKRTVRGVLNCCRHYFCFSCIIEWSKVESRCPLCKQRFATITKSAKSDTGFDLRTVVIPVPECDQVYQPSEEELRGYLDPYESVMCTECHNGGDDALMLLCDICDSSAHTFCVGLGREVPEGNWYCEGCRPTVFGTLNSQRPTPTSDRRLSGSATDLSSPVAGGFDLNELYVPETPLTQQTRVVLEPMSAPNGTVATTLRDRRRIHRQIHHRLLNNNRLSDLVAISNGTSASSSSGIRLFGSQLDQTRGSTPQNDHIMPSMHDTRIFSSRTDQFGVEVQSTNLVSVDGSLQDELGGLSMGFESRLGYAQLHPCTNRSSIGSDPCPSPYACREGIGPSRTSQGGLHAP